MHTKKDIIQQLKSMFMRSYITITRTWLFKYETYLWVKAGTLVTETSWKCMTLRDINWSKNTYQNQKQWQALAWSLLPANQRQKEKPIIEICFSHDTQAKGEKKKREKKERMQITPYYLLSKFLSSFSHMALRQLSALLVLHNNSDI